MENIVWSPDKFLSQFGSTLLMKVRGNNEKNDVNNMERTMQQSLTTRCQRLSKDIQQYTVQVRSSIFIKFSCCIMLI